MASPAGSDGAPKSEDLQPSSSSSRSSSRDSSISMGSNRSKEPRCLPIRKLQEITDNFSEERALGQGAYGKVYRGVFDNGEEIAVKLLHNNLQATNDEQFHHEFCNLMMLNHPNIVRLVGYCYETQRQHADFQGRIVFGETTYMALCFEYMHMGSLQRHLSDEHVGLDWNTRYKIIKGACEGLKYLHEGFKEPIYHLDIKPDNILLDGDMVPKLADFGLSKLFGEEQTRVTSSPLGTIGYMPPEYLFRQVVSKKLDVFSLGVVIMKIIAGPKGPTRSDEMPYQEFIDQVRENWRDRLEATCTSLRILEAYCEQVSICTELGLSSMEHDRHKRPSIVDTIDRLDASEIMIKEAISLSATSRSSMPVKTQREKDDNLMILSDSANLLDPMEVEEYMQNGRLHKHISDECEGLAWETRYKIIKGICEGLEYLHEGSDIPIYHLDLKPDNMLLGKDMVLKLADFVLSNLISDEQTEIAQDSTGTIGYSPTEFLHGGIVSNKLDIFSLGVVMIKIISGPEGRSRCTDMPRQEFLDQVHANWRNRWQKPYLSSRLVEAYCDQVKICTEIALSCMETDRHKRPTIADIMLQLNDIPDVRDEVQELTLLGLQNAGKTTLVNSIATDGYSEDMIPTVGFKMRTVMKGDVRIKLWDLAGQQRFRSMWKRYCRGVFAILYVVDAADRDSIPIAKAELHDLLTEESLAGIPVLILGNKIDKSDALSKPALVDQLGLESIPDREVCCYMISCKDSVNIDSVIDWLIKHLKPAN